ncbi:MULTISPECIES: hypothetical protein [Methylobacterium]|uniref:hypothetical protein n=1 Tax=Methylobacterium TaxID=407 RepID=UPI0011C94C79|nr:MULTISPECIES: hypothetical protein [Methylobacterium]TXN47954.1 hypothetical protein FV233_03305 [Methylobacterium sp. WL7]TXN71222.1 hypothetical protein FV228_11515 [Methylobacterium sp. WL18]GJE20761.1 hypothetical protein JHFBIEKO_1194 [Methylobacterium mesophilicum]
MRIVACIAALIVSMAVPALAQDFQRQRELNILKDIESSQRKQLELAREQARRDRDRARREENAYINAQRDARSARRFDRH